MQDDVPRSDIAFQATVLSSDAPVFLPRAAIVPVDRAVLSSGAAILASDPSLILPDATDRRVVTNARVGFSGTSRATGRTSCSWRPTS